MDDLDKRILDLIQSDFPLEARPYDAIGARVGLTGAEALARVRKLRSRGVIRRIGANFQSRRLGWSSTLCAARVPEDRLEEFAAEVNRHPGVTHNYLRRHRYNVWFTYIAPSREDIEAALAGISAKTGIEILDLPMEKMFKIKVDFDMNSEQGQDPGQEQ
ncbi:MAG: siroheme decarboxylase subunit alpha [Desulfovibrionaceae bacterium]|nr:siroheme decarboxylase subunit alpha [Desulfovibrionaceae bacterium]